MSAPKRRAIGVTALTAVGLLTGAAPASAAPTEPSHAEPSPTEPSHTEPSLTGAAQLYRLDGQDVRFTFDAHGFADQARGKFRFSHRDGDQFGWAEAKVDCLITGGPVATVTGIVTASNRPELIGHRKGVSVLDDGRHDRLGYSWAISEEAEPGLCMSMAPFETVRTGNFTVVNWLPPLPTK